MPMRLVVAPTSVVPLASYNARRETLSIANLGTDLVFIDQDQVGVAAKGFPLPANGVVVFNRRDGDEPELSYYVVANSATQALRVFEGFGSPEAPTGAEA